MMQQFVWSMVIWVASLGGDHTPVEVPNFQSQESCTRELDRIKTFSKGYLTGVCINKSNDRVSAVECPTNPWAAIR